MKRARLHDRPPRRFEPTPGAAAYPEHIMLNRPCCRVTCSRPAVATLTYDYGDRMAVIGPLSVVADPHAYDLCQLHAERLKVPDGWTIIRPVPLGHDV